MCSHVIHRCIVDKCLSCLICKVDGRDEMSLCFCMLSSLVLNWTLGTRPVHDGFRRLSTGSCTIRFGWIIVICRLNLSWTERFSFVRKLLLSNIVSSVIHDHGDYNLDWFPRCIAHAQGHGVVLPSAVCAAACTCILALCLCMRRRPSVSFVVVTTHSRAYVWLAYDLLCFIFTAYILFVELFSWFVINACLCCAFSVIQ